MKQTWRTFTAWLRNIPIDDPIERAQATLLQTMIIWLSLITLITIPGGFFVFTTISDAIRGSISSLLIFMFYVIALFMLRKGYFRRSVTISATGLLFGLTTILILEGLRSSGWLLSAFMMPITLAGLLTGRRGILTVGGLSIAAITIVGGLQLATTGIVGAFPREGDLLPPTISTFVLSTLVVVFFFHRFSASLRNALNSALQRQQELQQTRDHQEILISERTRDLTAMNQTMQRDLTLAHDIQIGLLPTQVPWAADSVLVVSRSIPATDVGGDFYTFIAFDDPRYVAVAVGDISGKGVGAALMMALMLSAVEAEARVNRCPAAVLTALNQHFYGRLKSNHMNAALMIIMIDLERQTLLVANAGMVFPLLLAAGTLETIEIGEFPLGSLPNLRYAERSLPFHPGDLLILQTDGVAEAHNRSGELFGFERMEAAVKALNAPTLEQAVAALFASVASFTKGTQQHDDITVVALQMAESEEHAKAEIGAGFQALNI